MTIDDAIDECRAAFSEGAPAWPAPLIRFLDDPPSLRRVFAWVIRCTRLLLIFLDELTESLKQQLALVESYVDQSPEVGVVRETLELLWVQRSPHETVKTAVVHLFGALVRYREADIYRHLQCTTSIVMLVDACADRGQAFELVIRDFKDFVTESSAEM